MTHWFTLMFKQWWLLGYGALRCADLCFLSFPHLTKWGSRILAKDASPSPPSLLLPRLVLQLVLLPWLGLGCRPVRNWLWSFLRIIRLLLLLFPVLPLALPSHYHYHFHHFHHHYHHHCSHYYPDLLVLESLHPGPPKNGPSGLTSGQHQTFLKVNPSKKTQCLLWKLSIQGLQPTSHRHSLNLFTRCCRCCCCCS